MKIRIYPTPKKIENYGDFVEFDSIKFNLNNIDDLAINEKIKEIQSKYSGKKELITNIEIDSNLDNFYQIDISNDVNIKASDEDMAFYAIVTIERLLEIDDKKLEKMTIKDYPSLKMRGMVEGYYGIPYSFQARMDTIEFGGKYKNNAYIYAPKDDPYHREKWFELYDDEKLEEIGKLAKQGNKYKNYFVWTIAPFYKKMIDLDNFDESMDKIIAKFEQLYSVGVRQFGVLGDDVGGLDPSIPVMMMNKLSKWKKTKDDVRDFVYCPASYNLSQEFWDAREINAYEREFPDDVHLFHTGRKVCAPISKKDLDDYKTKDSDGKVRKDPLFWLNFPVNDIDSNYRKLHLGELSVVDRDVDNLYGALTNPMQEAYASLIALFGISDYAWNIEAFDSKLNHDAAIKVLEPNLFYDLKVIARHMSNQDDRGIYGLNESWDIKDLLIDFDNANFPKIKEEFEIIISRCSHYLDFAENKKLRCDLEPFVLNLKEKLEAANYLIDAIDSLQYEKLSEYLYEKGMQKIYEANEHYIYVNPEKTKILKTESGTLYINQFIEKLVNKAKNLFSSQSITDAKVLYYPGMDGSKFYRIPLLYKTIDDTLLLISDRRNNKIMDWGDIDTVIRRKEKGKDFDEQVRVIDLPDLKDDEISGFTIDSSILQSKKTGRIFLFVTAFPNSNGFFEKNSESGSGYIEINGERYLELLDKYGEVLYLDGNKVKTIDGKDTSFTIFIDENQPFKRMGDIFHGDMMLGNIFVGNGPLELRKVSHILMTYSDDDGKTWQNLRMLNKEVKEDYMRFMGVSPSRGYELDNGRLVFPAYFSDKNNRQSSCLIVSDDQGETWKRKAIVNDGRQINNKVININEEYDETYQTGESSLIKHTNGDLSLIIRNYKTGIPRKFEAIVSTDNGESFRKYTKDLDFKAQSWCQMGTLLFEKDGKEYLLISAPSTDGKFLRLNGHINLLEFDGDEFKFVRTFPLDQGFFGYSSIEQIDKERFAIVYERSCDLNGDKIEIVYREFDLGIFDMINKNFEYNIVPKVQFIKYQNKLIEFNGLSIGNVDCDKYVFKKLESLIAEYGKGNLKVNIKIDEEFSREFDAYELTIDNEINIVALNNDAAYYALLTLEQILSQIDISNLLRKLEVHDFANQKTRGVIEGYYGIPWGNKKRSDIMRFISQLKGNVFIFAPKDDPYHRDKWYELYPNEELEEISKLARLGESIKTRYVWTISPFKKDSHPIDDDNFDERIVKLLQKFDQLYDCGVRQFGVLGDDVGKLPKETVVKVMKEVSKWGRDKSDVYDFIFVPASYVLADWGFDADELDIYSKEFSNDIEIIFTGETTCAPITQSAIDGFKNKETKIGPRRDPLFWMNWPVNDIDRKETIRVFMGKAEMYHKGVKGIVGTITNPMQEAYASFPAIFQTCDYAWNTESFDYEKSWRNSFKFIELETSEYLQEIATHMSNADNGGIEGLEESEELKELFDNLVLRIEKNSYQYEYFTRELIERFEKIMLSIENFLKNTKFEGLKEDLYPYISSLYYKSLASKYLLEKYLYESMDYDKGDISNLEILSKEALEKSKSFMVQTKTQEFPQTELIATAGTKVIDKIINYFE